MKKGVSTACFYPMKTEEALIEIGKRNIQCAEIFFDTFSEIRKDYIMELRKIADFYGVELTSMHPFTCAFEPFMLFTDYDRRFRDGLEFHRYYFEAMNLLGMKYFVFHGDRVLGQLSNHEYFERFAKLRDLGKEYGVTVAQENVERCKSRDINFLIEMIQYLDGDVALVFDNKQALRSGIDHNFFINTLAQYIVHVHLSDNNQNCDCLALGSGNLDINEFVKLLYANKYNGCLIVELYNELLKNNNEIFTSYENIIL